VLVPIVLFMLLTIRVVNQGLAHLSVAQKQLDAAWEKASLSSDRDRIEREMQVLQERSNVLATQSLLPTKRPFFRFLFVLNLVLLLILPPLITRTAPAGAGRFISDFACVLCGNSQRPPSKDLFRRGELLKLRNAG
jgi:hypothetical protein